MEISKVFVYCTCVAHYIVLCSTSFHGCFFFFFFFDLQTATVIICRISSISAPPPQPSFDMVPFSFTPPSLFTVKWTDPGGIAGYYFEVIGDGCGCNSTFYESNILTANCSGWTAVGQTCTFELCSVSQDCGFNSTISTESLILQR